MTEGRPAEAAASFAELQALLEADAGSDLRYCADVARLKGNAERNSGDLAASTASLQHAAALLEGRALTTDDQYLLAVILRSLALNAYQQGRHEEASRLTQQAEAIAGEIAGFLPESAGSLIAALEDDRPAAAGDPGPLARLQLHTRELALDPALRVLSELHQYQLKHRRDLTAMREGVNRSKEATEAETITSFILIHNIAWAALQARETEMAASLLYRMEGIWGSLNADVRYGAKRLEAHLAGIGGQHENAIAAFEAAYDISKGFGDGGERGRIAAAELGERLWQKRESERAVTWLERALDTEGGFGKDGPRAAQLSYILGRAYDECNRYTEAATAHKSALLIRQRVFGPGHELSIRSQYELGETSRLLGRTDEAEAHFLKAMEAAERTDEPGPTFRATIRQNLGELYLALERHEEARVMMDEALAIRTKLFGDDSEEAWRSRSGIASLLVETGDPQKAEEWARLALADARDGATHWALIRAAALMKQKRFAEAEPTYKSVVRAILPTHLGRGVTPEAYIEIARNLTQCLLARGEPGDAVKVAAGAVKMLQGYVAQILPDASESLLARLIRRVRPLQSLWFSTLIRLKSAGKPELVDAFESLQRFKGLRTRYIRWRQAGSPQVTRIPAPEEAARIRAMQEELRQLQTDLTAEELAAADPAVFERSRPALEKRARIHEIERYFSGRISDFKLGSQDADVLERIPLDAGTSALEMAVIEDSAAAAPGASSASTRYIGFLISTGSLTPQLVDFGFCADIDEAVAALRDSLTAEPWLDGAGEPAWSRLARFLGRKLVGPIVGRLKDTRHLLIAPDGVLAALPFELLRVPELHAVDGHLCDALDVSYVARLGDLPPRNLARPINSGILIFGGPDFELRDATTTARGNTILGPEGVRAAFRGHPRFSPLPASLEEGIVIGKLLDAEPLLGVWSLASELSRNDSPEIIHFSTHGFCLPYRGATGNAALLASSIGNELDRRTLLEDPMQRTGLAMAGANAALAGRPIPPEAGEGFLFAADVQQLDLQKTDLVVLSACRSGVGDVEIGDVALGLRRAFLAAGCRSVVCTLWDIPEKSALELMQRFYQELLSGLPRLAALGRARAALRQKFPKDPIHWCGFILEGQFGHLSRTNPGNRLKFMSLNAREWGIGQGGSPDSGQPWQAADPAGQTGITQMRDTLKRADTSAGRRLEVLFQLGNLANRLGDHDAGLTHFRAMLDNEAISEQDILSIQYDIAKIEHQMGRYPDAVKGYTALAERELPVELRTRLLVNRGVALMCMEREQEAHLDFTRVIETEEAPWDQCMMARMNRSSTWPDSELDAALEDIDCALSVAQKNQADEFALRARRAQLLLILGRIPDARTELAWFDTIPVADDSRWKTVEFLRSALPPAASPSR